MHNTENHHHGNGFMNGFLLGAIIGAAVVFFLFTEKGKKLLKTITEEGIEGFADLKDLVQEEMDDEEYEGDGEYQEDQHVTPVYHQPREASLESLHHSPSKVKRFFRGIKR